jgi:tetratricopeptide (TPR) repeat protein
VWLAILGATLAAATARAGLDPNAEVNFPDQAYERLDPFEAHSLKQADAAFPNDRKQRSVKTLREAAAAYDAFIVEFPRSKAVPYALLRKARCLHLEEKRFEAIKAYTEVLDYFPNDLPFAAPALYYIGEAHWQNGDEDEALKAWAEMAEDEDYAKSRFAATAINQLADALAKRDRREEAVQYYRQVAIDFRSSNPDAARDAMEQVIYHFIRRSPDEPELRRFYEQVGTFHGNPRKIEGEVIESGDYWHQVRWRVWRFGDFNDKQGQQRQRYFAYWAEQFEGRFPGWDDYQLSLAGFYRQADGDQAAWMRRVDAQFERKAEADDYDRVIKWIELYRHHPEKVDAYYQKLSFAKMSNKQIERLMDVAYDRLKNPELGRRVFGKLRLGEMSDEQRAKLARSMWGRDADAVARVCQSFDDKEWGRIELLRFYANPETREIKKGLALAEQVTGSPRFANEAYWHKAQLHKAAKQYREAIAAFQTFRPENEADPANLFEIADCYLKLDKLDAAVRQLGEIESFFKGHASEAAYRTALYYEKAGVKDKYIASLRAVMKKYPESRQSRQVHHRLEKMGLRIGGGVDDPDS